MIHFVRSRSCPELRPSSLDLRYDHQLNADGNIRTAVTGGIDRTMIDNGRFLRDRLVGTRSEVAYRLSERALLRAGADMQLDSYDIELNTGDLAPSQARLVNAFPSRTDLVVGGRADVVFKMHTPGSR